MCEIRIQIEHVKHDIQINLVKLGKIGRRVGKDNWVKQVSESNRKG